MGGRALEAPVLDAARPRQDDGSRPSPAAQLLDSLHTGDDQGVLAACGESTTVTADIMGWSCTGLDQIEAMLVQTRNRFPGLVYESRTRHIGFGLVIEEARVRDATPDAEVDPGEAGRRVAEVDERAEVAEVAEVDDLADLEASLGHPMYDEPIDPGGAELQLWRDLGGDGPAEPLNLPVRVTVRHDDLQVHEVTFELPGRPAQAGVRVARGPARDVAERGAVGVHRPGRGRVHHVRAGASRAHARACGRTGARDRHRGATSSPTSWETAAAPAAAGRCARRGRLVLRAGPRGPLAVLVLERTEPVAVRRGLAHAVGDTLTDSSGLAVGDVDAAADGDPLGADEPHRRASPTSP